VTLSYPDPPLTDGELLLRPWDETDLRLVERASRDDYVATIEHLPVPFSDEQGRAWITAQHKLLDESRGWTFAIVDRKTSEAVGGIGIVYRHPPGTAEPGAWVIADKRNGGVAERATRLLCFWVLTNETGIERIQATVEPWNLASQRVLEKVGFTREGLLRSYASWHGSRQDALLYSLIRSDVPTGASADTEASGS
jgi:RimJ/RimL family protein N-acetyltransferase